MNSSNQRPVVLIIRDGWGEPVPGAIGYAAEADAIALASTPVDDELRRTAPSTLLDCSGVAVGLPEGQMGNSEVGHLNLGAGRIVYQDITRIHLAIEDKTFFDNPVLHELAATINKTRGRMHLIGLCSDGGVHSHIEHLHALIDFFAGRKMSVAVHCIMDGRDTSPTSGAGFVRDVASHLDSTGSGFIATVVGRYYAMDRDKRWDRTGDAYRAIVDREGTRVQDAEAAINEAYGGGVTDEFLRPVVVEVEREYSGLRPEDGIIFFNFRADRARQLSAAFVSSEFNHFARRAHSSAQFASMTQYEDAVPYGVLFPPQDLSNVLTDVLSAAQMKQLRAAETEKYAHVTYFFNGGREEARPLEDRCMVPSPKVATYDLKPEMSARELTDAVLERCRADTYDFVLVNYANVDMVGHSADIPATIKAVEVVDRCVGELIDCFLAQGGVLLITSDHGNAEMLRDSGGNPWTAHTTNPVRLHMVGDNQHRTLRAGILGDVAPTVLEILGLEQPPEMSGKSLLQIGAGK